MGKRLSHLKTIIRHRKEVRKACFKMGLYRQGIMHDMSKFSKVELSTGFKYYEKGISPIDIEKRAGNGSKGWQNHHNKNPHHWEYWVDFRTIKDENGNKKMIAYGVKWKFKYVLEMIADFIGAGKIYQGVNWDRTQPLKYHLEKLPFRIYNKETDNLILLLLNIIAYKDDNYKKALKFIRKNKKYFETLYNDGVENYLDLYKEYNLSVD